MASNEVTIRVTAEDHASGPIQNVRSRVGEMALGFGTGLIATQALTAGFSFLAGQVSSSVSAFMESEVATAKLNAVLKSTGGAAGVTADEAQRLATELQRLTGTSDEEIVNAQTLLLTFTKIGADIFPQATKAALDMSTVFGQDLRSSAIQLGKALNEPIEGVAALRRVGVQLTDQQEEAIKKFVELGEIEKAQAVILGELTTQVGGAAEAFGTTAAGKVAIFSQTIDDMKERLGGALVEGLTPLIDRLNEWSQTEDAELFITNLVAVINGLATAFVFVATHVDDVIRVIKILMPQLEAIVPIWNAIRAVVDAVTSALAAVVDGFDQAVAAAQRFTTAANSAKAAAPSGLGALFGPIGMLGGMVGIPGFASGGIVPGPVGAPQLAVVHGGERVIPNGGGGNSITINFNGVVTDPVAVGQEIARMLNRAATSTGPILSAQVVG